jgi:surface antigen
VLVPDLPNAPVPVSSDAPPRVVHGSVVDDQQFKVSMGLPTHAVDGTRQDMGAVERGKDDAEVRVAGGATVRVPGRTVWTGLMVAEQLEPGRVTA